MSGEKHFQKTFTRRKKACDPSNNVNNVQKRDEENEKQKGKEVEVEDGDQALREENANADEVSVVPSSSAESQGGSGDIDGEIARKPIDNGGCGSSSVSMTATRKGMCDGDSCNGRVQEKKRHKEEKQSQQGKQKKQRKEEVLKAKPKLKPKQEQKKKKKGKDGGERDNVKNKKETYEEKEEASAGCRFPVSRVDRIIRSGSDYRITHEAILLINKATEKFLEIFCEDSYDCAAHDCKNYVSYNHLSTVVSKKDRFDFLSDYVPEKVKAETALANRKPVEK